MSDEMEEVEASRLKTRLLINPIGAPKCDVCKIEPYSDINLMHTIEVVDFEPERKLPITPKSNE